MKESESERGGEGGGGAAVDAYFLGAPVLKKAT
jgi:hypothetical protein